MNIKEETKRILDTISQEQWGAIMEVFQEMAKPTVERVTPKEKIPLTSQVQETEPETSQIKISEIEITEILKKIGVPCHIKGYYYLKEAISLVIQDDTYRDGVTKKLYPDIAKKYGTTSSRVERAIRHAIEVAWERGSTKKQTEVFENTIDDSRGCPTNSEFIATLTEYLKVN